MHRIKNIGAFFLTVMVLHSCIKPYDPDIETSVSSQYVVSGQVTSQEGYQEVSVSMTSSLENPEQIPVNGCKVEIHDDLGHVFVMEETNPGKYGAWIDGEYLNPGTAYKVIVTTPTAEILESDYDTMAACPPIDTVYYLREDLPTSDPAQPMPGIQFYVDLDATGYDDRYFMWDLEETWEYNVRFAKEYYYDGDFHKIDPPDSSLMTCWITRPVDYVFTLTTLNLAQNRYLNYPLQFVDNESSRLLILYSLNITQMALSEGAYVFWDQMRINSSELGGLYEKQPITIVGNMHDRTDPSRKVLGFFYAAGINVKRIFVKDVPGLEMNVQDFCGPMPLGRFKWKEFRPDQYPVYYYFNESHAVRTLTEECYDCRSYGGVQVKPDFWPDDE